MAEHSSTEIASQHTTAPASMRAENFGAADPARDQVESDMRSLQPTAGSDAPSLQPATLAEVETLLNGFRMLVLRHFIRRETSGSPVVSDARPGVQGQEAPPFLPGVYLVLLTKSPKEIAENDVFLRQLCSSIEVLTDLAAPATVSSIYLTSAFLRDEASSIASAEAKLAARRLRRWAMITAILGLVFFSVAVMLLVHVDRGRREIQQLEQVREEYRLIISSMDQRHDPDQIADCTKDLSAPQPHSNLAYQPWCERLRDVLQRMDIARRGLGDWNIISYRLAYALPIRWLGVRQPLPPDLSEERWDASELRASAVMAGFTGFVLPMLLGLLGAFTYVYRDLDRRVQAATLVPGDSLHGTLRMLLGTILGGLLGVVWTNGEPIKLEGVTLSLTALAFFVGYSVEVVFQTLDTVIGKVASAIGK
jgi:hypothetical protein